MLRILVLNFFLLGGCPQLVAAQLSQNSAVFSNQKGQYLFLEPSSPASSFFYSDGRKLWLQKVTVGKKQGEWTPLHFVDEDFPNPYTFYERSPDASPVSSVSGAALSENRIMVRCGVNVMNYDSLERNRSMQLIARLEKNIESETKKTPCNAFFATTKRPRKARPH